MAQQADVRVLSRQTGGASGASSSNIPPPGGRWRTRVLPLVAVVGGAGLLLGIAAIDTLAPTLDVQAVPVIQKESAARSLPGTAVVQAAGWIESNPYQYAITALAGGVVRELLVLEGEHVRAGQVVARLVDDDARLAVQRAQAEVLERQAMLLAAQAMVEAASSDWEHPVELRRALDAAQAKQSELQARIREQEAEVVMEDAMLVQARDEFQRSARLSQTNAIAEINMVQVRSRMEAQQAKLETVRARGEMLQAQLVAARADLVAARENLSLRTMDRQRLQTTQAEVENQRAALVGARAMLEEANLRLERMEIRAMMDGVVTRRLVMPGSKVMMEGDDMHSAHVLHLYDPERMQVRVDVALIDAAKVGVGQPAEIVVEVLPEVVFHGTVTRVLHEANIAKNTLEVKVAIQDPSPVLRPEMLARVRFLAPQEQDTDEPPTQRLFAPNQAVQTDDGRSVAWRVEGYDGRVGRARAKPVQLGPGREADHSEIASGLQPGDMVIITANGRLKEGRRVRVLR